MKQLTAILLLVLVSLGTAAFAKDANETTASASDPVLRAMLQELSRSKAKLKLEDVAAPYYIEYSMQDVQELNAEAAFGALRIENHARARLLRVVVRVGNYKQDSYFGEGEGTANIASIEDDVEALRRQLWLTTDRAYKMAGEALSEKQAALKDKNVEFPVDDFAKANPVTSILPLVKLEINSQNWIETLQAASALYRRDPQVEEFDAKLQCSAINRYFVNTEGTVVREGKATYFVHVSGSTQAADGMRLSREWTRGGSRPDELPQRANVLEKSGEVLASLKELRDAPIADEDYRGPVLFSPGAAESIVDNLIGRNALGQKPPLGTPARTTGQWSAEYKSRVLPEFLSVQDDPTMKTFQDRTLVGSYQVDDEGVPAQRVSIVEKGKLVNYLIGREPIRDFSESNGHGRARLGRAPGPEAGVLMVESTEPVPAAELKKKLIAIAKQHDLKYGYFVESMGGKSSPRILRRIWVNDGHEELVRGGLFGELDTRSLRSDVIAAGDDLEASNRGDVVPQSIINPSLLFDELQVKRLDASKDKLPEYPAPALQSSAP
jgi:predicted Zn-dependent protease